MDRIKREFLSYLNAKTILFLILVVIVLLLFTISQFGYVQHNILGLRHSSPQLFFEPYHRNYAQLNYFRDTINATVFSESVNTYSLSDKTFVPEMTVFNETELFLLTEKESNIAINYWSKWKAINKKNEWSDENITVCSNVDLPKPDTIRFNNIYWQQFIVDNNLTLYLYNAYLDNRQSVSTVKIIAMTDNQIATDNITLGCYLWFDVNRKPVLSKVSSIYTFWPKYWDWGRKRGVYGPLYVACDIPITLKHLVPKAVSLTIDDTCESNNDILLTHNLRVIYNKAVVRQEFGVCVQALRFASVDFSVRLIEWLEMLKILGANKVFLYKFGAHPNIEKVLQFYSKNNFVDWRQLTLPDTQINSRYLYQWYFEQIGGKFWPQEMLELNDCLYRNIYNYKYIAIFDVDELIVPITSYNWSQLIRQIQESINDESLVKSYGYYENINSYVYKNLELNEIIDIDNEKDSHLVSIPSYMYTMRHVFRKEFTDAGSNIKCFHNTDLVEAVHNHFPLKCLGKEGYHNCAGHPINTNHSFLFHFKREIMSPDMCNSTDIKECAIYDTTLWKYYTQLDTNMKIAFQNIFHN